MTVEKERKFRLKFEKKLLLFFTLLPNHTFSHCLSGTQAEHRLFITPKGVFRALRVGGNQKKESHFILLFGIPIYQKPESSFGGSDKSGLRKRTRIDLEKSGILKVAKSKIEVKPRKKRSSRTQHRARFRMSTLRRKRCHENGCPLLSQIMLL